MPSTGESTPLAGLEFDIDRVKRQYFGSGSAFEGLITFGVNLRGLSQSDEPTYFEDMKQARERGLKVAIHAGQSAPNTLFAEDYEKRGWLGPDRLICHYIPASDSDAAAMARTQTPLSFSTLSEFRLGQTGDPRAALLRMRKAGVLVSLSFDATSIAPLNMFETMRFTWDMGVPWKGTPTEGLPPVSLPNWPHLSFRRRPPCRSGQVGEGAKTLLLMQKQEDGTRTRLSKSTDRALDVQLGIKTPSPCPTCVRYGPQANTGRQGHDVVLCATSSSLGLATACRH